MSETNYMQIIPQWMLDAARELRIKIHGISGDCPANSPDNPHNKRWLDQIVGADAAIILRHYNLAAIKQSQTLNGEKP